MEISNRILSPELFDEDSALIEIITKLKAEEQVTSQQLSKAFQDDDDTEWQSYLGLINLLYAQLKRKHEPAMPLKSKMGETLRLRG